jgi:AcrR family transcriptional regulator
LPEALLDALLEAAFERLEVDGAEAMSLPDITRAAGVNHRKASRQFPDKLSLLAHVAQEGWRRLIQRMSNETTGKRPGEPMLVAAGVEFFLFARERPNLFHLMSGPRIISDDKFPDLEAAMADALAIFAQGFVGLGLPPETARERAAVFVAALQGVTAQILQRQLRVAPVKTKSFVTDVCKKLVKGLW